MSTHPNIDMALSIVQHPEATPTEKAQAGVYLGGWVTAGGTFTAGAGLGVCSLAVPCAAAAETALGISTTACSDGDCLNEIDQANMAYGVTIEQINELKNLNVYEQFNTLNQYMTADELKTAMFDTGINYEMIATIGAPLYQYTFGMLKYAIETGKMAELYENLIYVNPYLAEVLAPLVTTGG